MFVFQLALQYEAVNSEQLSLEEGKVALRVVLGGERYLASGDNVECAKHAASLQVRMNILLVGGGLMGGGSC